MSDLEKNRVLYGVLKSASYALENIRCEVNLNPLQPSTMTANIFDVQGTNSFRFMKDFMGQEVTFECSSESEQIIFAGVVTSVQSSGTTDKIGAVRIDSYRQDFFLNREPIVSATFVYYLTPVDMFKRTRMMCSHDMRGLLFGYDDYTDEKSPIWKEESHSYSTNVGQLVFYPGLVFDEDDTGNVIVREQLKVAITVKEQEIDVETLKSSIEKTLEDYLYIISFLEGKFLYWFYSEIDARALSGKGFVSNVYKRIPIWEYGKSQYLERYAKEYRQIVPGLVTKYISLADQKKLDLDKAIKQLLVASKPAQPIDTELIYWHSCLDILLKAISGESVVERKYIAFSRKLVLACEEANIEWVDLYPYVKRDEIFSDDVRADFRITTLRNNMIHEGNYPDPQQFGEVIAENSRAAALAERMILSILGVDYRNSPAGGFRPVR